MNTDVVRNTLFVTDLDGTLLDDCSRVSPHSAHLLSELSRKGAKITAATARTPATVQHLLSAVRSRVAAIVMTGAALWDRNAYRYLKVSYMDSEVARKVTDVCRESGINPFIYTLDEASGLLHVYHNGECSRVEQRFIDERRRLPLKRFHLNEAAGAKPCISGTILMFAMGLRDSIFAIADELRATVDCSVSAYIDIFGADTGILEVFASGVSKAAAIRSLATDLGTRRIVVFGDNLNDIPMMQVADSSYAVANALPQVKEVATEVIGPNTADSVATTIAGLCGYFE